MYVRDEVYCEISKEMSSLYFALDVLCQFEATCRVESQNLTLCSVYNANCTGGGKVCGSNSGTLDSNRQKTASPKYNDDISLLISHYLIPDVFTLRKEYF
jgi:hypothetical protein